MVTKELIKSEIDRVRDEYLEALYRIVKALETHPDTDASNLPGANAPGKDRTPKWRDFVQEMYGCLSDAPIERGDQGSYEVRGKIG